LRCLESNFQRTRCDRGRRPQRRPRPAFTPRLVSLEDRIVPSTFTVENFADSGPGSLRQAVLDANALTGADLISFAPAACDGTIALATGELGITDDLTIDGPGAESLIISGNNSSRVFEVPAGVTVTIDGMTIRDGLANGRSPTIASTGGGILNFGRLTLANVVLSDNQAVGDPNASALGGRVGAALGGAVANLGTATLTVSHSAFTGNQALGADGSNGNGAGGAQAGAIDNFATASVSHSQFSHNVARAGSDNTGNSAATGAGGGIFNGGSLTLTNSKFRHNQAIGGNDSSSEIRPGFGVGGAIVSGGSLGVTGRRAWWSAPVRSTTIRPSAATGTKAATRHPAFSAPTA